MTCLLAGLGELFVISRGSTLMFRGKRADPREVGQALGVRYVLLGTLPPLAANYPRLDAALRRDHRGQPVERDDRSCRRASCSTCRTAWSPAWSPGIAPNVRAAELRAALRKRPESFTAYDRTLRAMHVMHELDPRTYGEARKLLGEAMADDPSFAMPVAWGGGARRASV